MSIFIDAYMGINEDPHRLTREGSDELFDIFEHLSNGGTIYDYKDFEPEAVVLFFAIAMRTIQQMGS